MRIDVFRWAMALLVASLLAGCATDSLRTHGEPEKAAAAETKARQRARAHVDLAALYFQERNMAVALEEVAIAIDADPTYAPAYNVRGLVQMYLKENGPADENFRKALDLTPIDPEINNNYGWFLCQVGREQESFKYFMAALKNSLYKTPEISLVNAGLCSVKINDLKGAEEYYQKALLMGRNRAVVLVPMAQLEFRRGDFPEAMHHLEEYHRLAAPNAESLWLAVRAERKLGNRRAENEYATQLRRSFPDSREARDLRRGSYE